MRGAESVIRHFSSCILNAIAYLRADIFIVSTSNRRLTASFLFFFFLFFLLFFLSLLFFLLFSPTKLYERDRSEDTSETQRAVSLVVSVRCVMKNFRKIRSPTSFPPTRIIIIQRRFGRDKKLREEKKKEEVTTTSRVDFT